MAIIIPLHDHRAIEQEAAEWLIKLDGDHAPNEEDLKQLKQWMQRSPAHRAELNSLNHFWRNNVLTELLVPLGKHDARTPNKWVKYAAPFACARLNYLAAAIMVLAVCMGCLQMVLNMNSWQDSNGLYLTAVGQHKSTTLADGSVVSLNTNSQIQVEYSEHFRNIHLLQGEVHFEVSKDSLRPFRVYAGSGRVEAVGTAFSVYLKNNDANIVVAEGSVALASLGSSSPSLFELTDPADNLDPYINGQTKTLGILTAKQSYTIKTNRNLQQPEHAIAKKIELISDEELARRQAWRNGLLVFAGESLAKVVAEISRYTTVSIDIVDPGIRAIQIGGRFRTGDTDAMLAYLESNFDLKVTKLSFNHIELSSAKYDGNKRALL